MNIRRANVVDIERCARLDGGYRTQHVWQMDERRESESVGVSFRRVRIPRQITVSYPRAVDALQDDWQRNECFLVAGRAWAPDGLPRHDCQPLAMAGYHRAPNHRPALPSTGRRGATAGGRRALGARKRADGHYHGRAGQERPGHLASEQSADTCFAGTWTSITSTATLPCSSASIYRGTSWHPVRRPHPQEAVCAHSTPRRPRQQVR